MTVKAYEEWLGQRRAESFDFREEFCAVSGQEAWDAAWAAANGEWISVEEALPEKEGFEGDVCVLVTVDFGDYTATLPTKFSYSFARRFQAAGEMTFERFSRNKESLFFECAYKSGYTVTHWRRMPQPAGKAVK